MAGVKVEPKKNHGSEILKCSCKHPGQDSLHGPSMRVCNNTLKGYQCSVCLAYRDKPKRAE